MINSNMEYLADMMMETQKLNKQQISEAIYWMVLGDGCIEKPERGNCRFSVSHRYNHLDYIQWKYSIIAQFTSCTITKLAIQGGFTNSHEMYRLRSSAHPWFTAVRERLYEVIGRKSIDPHAVALISPMTLAILYQDDGSYHYSPAAGHNIMLHKLCYSKYELEAFAKAVVDKFGFIFRVNYDKGKGQGCRLRLRASDRERFFALIEPYIVPSMFYKIGKGDLPDKEVNMCSELYSDVENSAEMSESLLLQE